jgi:hypothetical protein
MIVTETPPQVVKLKAIHAFVIIMIVTETPQVVKLKAIYAFVRKEGVTTFSMRQY